MALYKIRLDLVLNPGPDRVYTVTSPDVPFVVEGSTPEEIRDNVQDVVNSMVEIYQREGWELPPALRGVDKGDFVTTNTYFALNRLKSNHS